jgi:hypothetical protein
VHDRLGGQRVDHPDGLQGRCQHAVVAPVGPGWYRRQRDATRLDGD